MVVSEKTMQKLVDIMDEEIGVTFSIDALVDITTRTKALCEEEGLDENALPTVFLEELRKYKRDNKIFGFGRMKYAVLFENPRTAAGAAGA